MLNKHSDLLIVGDGPAAAASALLALKAGLSVTILSSPKKNSPFKAIQSLYPDIVKLLELLECEDILINSQAGRYSHISINGIRTALSNYKEIPDVGYHINRVDFDKQLLKKASENGCELITDTAQKLIVDNSGKISGVHTSKGDIISTDTIIDATGVMRFSGRQLKIKEKFFSPEFIVTTGQVINKRQLKQEQIFEFHTLKSGWYWIIETGESLTWTKLCLKGLQNLKPPKVLKEYKPLGKVSAQNMT